MFTKRELMEMGNSKTEMDNIHMENHEKNTIEPVQKKKVNTIVKGSKLIGNIHINYDLELDGEVEGNITSDEDSNIIIKGNCKGSIKTKGGNVTIEGEMSNGDISAGGDVKITGKFSGGKIEARGKIYVGGEFSGKMESNEIEIGKDARGKGEIFYKELISIARGAKIEANITLLPEDPNETKRASKGNGNKNDHKKEVGSDSVQQLISMTNNTN